MIKYIKYNISYIKLYTYIHYTTRVLADRLFIIQKTSQKWPPATVFTQGCDLRGLIMFKSDYIGRIESNRRGKCCWAFWWTFLAREENNISRLHCAYFETVSCTESRDLLSANLTARIVHLFFDINISLSLFSERVFLVIMFFRASVLSKL